MKETAKISAIRTLLAAAVISALITAVALWYTGRSLASMTEGILERDSAIMFVKVAVGGVLLNFVSCIAAFFALLKTKSLTERG